MLLIAVFDRFWNPSFQLAHGPEGMSCPYLTESSNAKDPIGFGFGLGLGFAAAT